LVVPPFLEGWWWFLEEGLGDFLSFEKRITLKLSRWGSGLGMWKGSETEVYKGKAHLSKTILRKGRVSWIELVVCLPTLDMEISSRGLERLANWRKRISLKS
jgi:hypothetical protein